MTPERFNAIKSLYAASKRVGTNIHYSLVGDCIAEIERLHKLVEDAYYEGGSIVTDFDEQFDEDNSLWLDSESRKALENK